MFSGTRFTLNFQTIRVRSSSNLSRIMRVGERPRILRGRGFSLDIAVLLKPVPDPEHYEKIQLDPVSGILVREGLKTVINPEDKHALEAALQLKEKYGGRVALIGMAPADTVETFKEGLAMGADEAFLCSDKAFAGADSLATARVLANAVEKAGPFDLVLSGSSSADGGTAHVPSQVGELLGLAHLTHVIHLDIKLEGSAVIRTRTENGYREYRGRLPLVCGIRRELNIPRYISLPGIMAAQAKPVQVWSLEDLGLDRKDVGLAGSPTRPGKLAQPDIRRKGEIIQGEAQEVAQRILAILRTAGVIG